MEMIDRTVAGSKGADNLSEWLFRIPAFGDARFFARKLWYYSAH